MTNNVAEATNKPIRDELGVRKSLAFSCVDEPTVIGSTIGFLRSRGAIIIEHEFNYLDVHRTCIAFRVVFELARMSTQELGVDFSQQVAYRYRMNFRFGSESAISRVAVMVSRDEHGHCMRDLLKRQHDGTMPIRITQVISNHRDLEHEVRSAGVPFSHIRVDPGDKSAAEHRQLDALPGDVDLIILARYMQIVSREFIEQAGVPIINIHHSLLPAFRGADPYRQAMEAGVKVIGATSHYVTPELDCGPIIAQSAIEVADHCSVEELRRRGAGVECRVLARAVEAHCRNRVVVNDTTTMVF